MKRTLAMFALLVPLAASASAVSLGATSLEIPAPSGFAPITEQMTALFPFEQNLVAPANEELVAFVSADEAATALEGKLPEGSRKFAVQTMKQLVPLSVPSSYFAELKSGMKAGNEEIFTRVQKSSPEMLDHIRNGLSAKYKADIAQSTSSMVPLPAHEETERSLSYSVIIKDQMQDGSIEVTACTTTLLYVRGKILFLYVYAEDSALQWTRDESKRWADAILAANPSGPRNSIAEGASSVLSNTTWTQVGIRAGFGALIGMAGGLVAWRRKRSKDR